MSKKDNREWHDDFIEYTEFIVSHPNYKGLYYERGEKGLVKWVVTGKSEEGKERRRWWDEQCRENGISINPGCYANIARIMHPTMGLEEAFDIEIPDEDIEKMETIDDVITYLARHIVVSVK